MPDDLASVEVRHSDANHALFMVLIECCQIILDTSDDPGASVAIVAGNIKGSGKTKMANKEIAECAYRLALGLKGWKHPHAASLERVVAQIMLADRWEAQLRR